MLQLIATLCRPQIQEASWLSTSHTQLAFLTFLLTVQQQQQQTCYRAVSQRHPGQQHQNNKD